MAVVGSAYIIARALTNQLRGDIGDGFKDAIRRAAPGINAEVSRAITNPTIKPEIDVDGATAEGAKAGVGIAAGIRSMGLLIGRAVRGAISGTQGFRAGFQQGTSAGLGIISGLRAFKVSKLIWATALGIPALLSVLNGLIAYASAIPAIIGAIGPAFAALGGVIASGGVGLLGIIALTIAALKSESAALQSLKDRASELAPVFQEFANSMGDALFPGVESALVSIASLLPAITPGLAAMAGSLGGLAASAAAFLSETENAAVLNGIFAANGQALSIFGGTLNNILDIVLTLGNAGNPILIRFNEYLAEITGNAAESLRAFSDSGGLAALLDRGAAAARTLSGILGNTFQGLVRFFGAAAEGSGDSLLQSILDISQRFKDFTGSVEGRNTIVAFFEGARPAITAINGLIGDLAGAINGAVSGDGLDGFVSFIDLLRNQILPALGEVVDAGSMLGPTLMELAGAFAGLVQGLADSGALQDFADKLNFAFGIITQIVSSPLAAQFAAFVLPILAVGAAANTIIGPFRFLGNFLTGFLPLFQAISSLVGVLGSAFLTVARVALPLVITGVRLLGAALLANPIGIVVTVIGLLVGALILAYQNSETFRAVVDRVGAALSGAFRSAFEWLRDNIPPIWDQIVAGAKAFGTGVADAVGSVIGFFDRLRTGFTTLIDLIAAGDFRTILETVLGSIPGGGVLLGFIDQVVAGFGVLSGFLTGTLFPIFGQILNVISQPIQGIIAILIGFKDILVGVFTGDLNQIIDGVAGIIGGIVQFFLGMPARILAAILPVIPLVIGFFAGLFTQAGTAVETGNTTIIAFFRALPGRIISAVSAFASMLAGWIRTAWAALQSALNTAATATVAYVRAYPANLVRNLSTLGGLLSGAIRTAWSALQSALNGAANATISYIKAYPGNFARNLNTLGGLLSGAIRTAWSALQSALSSAASGTISFVGGIPGRIRAGLGALGSLLQSAGSDLISGFRQGIENGIDSAVAAARRLANAVKSAVTGALGISSPSKVFRELGVFTGDGLRLGLRDMLRPVALAGADLARAATPTIDPISLSQGSGAGSAGAAAQAPGKVVNFNIDAGTAALARFGREVVIDSFAEYEQQEAREMETL